jgi:tetraacyldisaccharide 4'-kinase
LPPLPHRLTTFRARIAERLERGGAGNLVLRAASRLWAAKASASLAKTLWIPARLRVVAVGSAVLGGAGKTPLSIAIARALSHAGERVAFVGHAYRARPTRSRIVSTSDALAEVGDDALFAARALEPDAVPVLVAPTRQAALDHAADIGATIAVVDGLLQARPERVEHALLVVDPTRPWGAGACPPLGDLRAPRTALLGCSDHLVALTHPGERPALEGVVAVPTSTRAACPVGGAPVPLGKLDGARIGLFLAIARPRRVERALAEAGVVPTTTILLGDHDAPGKRLLEAARRARVDVWLTTERCAEKLPAALGGSPVLALRQELDVTELVERLGFRSREPAFPLC